MGVNLAVPSDELCVKLNERRSPEPPPSIRTEAQRDRDRILYSSAFLRLGHVTQVAAPEIGHTFHSRLTHSLKVAQVAGGLAQRLKKLRERLELDVQTCKLVDALDPSAAEAAALAHDLGHPPFGHLAEKVLQKRSEGRATFEGNPQSFRIVTRLALRSVEIPGLNLTRRTLNGLLKYPWPRAEEPPHRSKKWGAYDGDREYFDWARDGIPSDQRTLEAELMDWADDVTYAVHDMDDFYRAGLVPLDKLTSDSLEREAFQQYLKQTRGEDGERMAVAAQRLFEGFVSSVRMRFAGRAEERINLRAVGSALIGRYIAAVKLNDSEDGASVVLDINDDVRDEVEILKALTWYYIIERPSLAVIQQGQAKIIESLYDMYRQAIVDRDLELFPPAYAERVETANGEAALERVVIDLIAGMTEASATEIYRQHLGVSHGSLLSRPTGPI